MSGVDLERRGARRVEPEGADHLREPDRLLLERLSGGGRLLDERGVLLRHLVELGDGAIDLADPFALLGSGGGDLADDCLLYTSDAADE